MAFTPEELKAEFGIENVEDIKSALTDYATIKPKFTEYETELNTIKPEFEKLKSTPPTLPYGSKLSEFVDGLAKNGMDDEQIAEAIKFNKVEPEKLEGEQAYKLAAKLKNKGWNDNHAEAQFRADFTVPEDADDNTKTLMEGKKIAAFNDSKAFLKEYIGKKFQPPVDVQAQQREIKNKELTEFWSGKAPSLVAQMKELKGERTIKLPGGKGEVEVKVPFGLTIPDADLKGITELAVKTAVQNGIPNTEEGAKQVADFVQRVIKSNYGDAMQQKLADALQTQSIEFIQKEFHNADPNRGGGNGNIGTRTEVSREDAIYAKARKAQGK